MEIGYACIALSLLGAKQFSCIQKFASNEKLNAITLANLKALDKIIDYNNQNNIRLFRISSHFIPFGSSPVNSTNWQNDFKCEFDYIAKKIKDYGIRISTHPGQYTVLNAENSDIVKRAEKDLIYHYNLLSCLGADSKNKIILHIGGRYNDKKEAIKRFIANYKKLSSILKNNIVIENDDVNFNIEDVLYIGQTLNIPVVFDALHNAINRPIIYNSDDYYIKRCKSLWQTKDGNIKIHYSQQATGTKAGAHSKSIKIMPFIDYYHTIEKNNADIMLEVKDKNLSALKCFNTAKNDFNGFLKDFERYKFSLMSKSPLIYNTIKENTLKGYNILALYSQIENALSQKKDESIYYTLLFIKDILKCDMTANQLKKFDSYFARVKKGSLSVFALKNYLYSLSVQFNIKEIYESYFFVL